MVKYLIMFYYLLNYIAKKIKTTFQLGQWADLGILENISDTEEKSA